MIKSVNEIDKGLTAPEDATSGEPPIDCVGLLRRIGADIELLAELTDVFRQNYPAQLAELRQATIAGDHLRVEHVAHALRGALGSLGAVPASQSAKRLEEMGRGANLSGATAECSRLEQEITRAESALTRLCREGLR